MREKEAHRALDKLLARIKDAAIVAVVTVEEDGSYAVSAEPGEDLSVVALGIRGVRKGRPTVERDTVLREIGDMR